MDICLVMIFWRDRKMSKTITWNEDNSYVVLSYLRSQCWLEWVSCVSHRRFGLGTVVISSDLMDRFERRGSMVRRCLKGLNCGWRQESAYCRITWQPSYSSCNAIKITAFAACYYEYGLWWRIHCNESLAVCYQVPSVVGSKVIWW